MSESKTATVGKERSGYWAAIDDKTGHRIGGLQDSELDAYKVANANGYLVR